jgi:hypothetical protein
LATLSHVWASTTVITEIFMGSSGAGGQIAITSLKKHEKIRCLESER